VHEYVTDIEALGTGSMVYVGEAFDAEGKNGDVIELFVGTARPGWSKVPKYTPTSVWARCAPVDGSAAVVAPANTVFKKKFKGDNWRKKAWLCGADGLPDINCNLRSLGECTDNPHMISIAARTADLMTNAAMHAALPLDAPDRPRPAARPDACFPRVASPVTVPGAARPRGAVIHLDEMSGDNRSLIAMDTVVQAREPVDQDALNQRKVHRLQHLQSLGTELLDVGHPDAGAHLVDVYLPAVAASGGGSQVATNTQANDPAHYVHDPYVGMHEFMEALNDSPHSARTVRVMSVLTVMRHMQRSMSITLLRWKTREARHFG
jgi:hypothetical protein